MKKLLSVVLSLLLAFGLTVPALADGEDGPPDVELSDADTAELLAALVDLQKEELGLTGNLNVMVDGKVLQFAEDAMPEIVNGSTMIPLEALAEALGAETCTYDAATGEVKLVSGSTEVRCSIGGGSVMFDTVRGDGGGSGGNIFLDDVSPYLKGDVIYVPLRAIAEALGYDVEWSDTFRTAVLMDKAGFAAALDQKFTVLNAVLSMSGDLDMTQAYGGESALDVSVTLLDSINGDRTYTGSVTATALQNDLIAYAAVQYNWNELMGLLYLTGVSEGDAQELLDLLGDGIETVIDMQTGRMYMRGALLSLAFGVEDAGETWFSMDLDTMYGGALDFAELSKRQSITVGELAEMLEPLLSMDDPVYSYAALTTMAEALDFLSDSHFTQEGNVWRYAVELPGIGEETKSGGEIALDVTMEDGKATNITGSVSYEAADLFSPGADGKLVCSLAFSPMQIAFNGTVDVKNVVHVEFSLTAENVPALDAELPAVPAEAVALDDLLADSLGVIGGADGPTAIITTPLG